MVQTGGGGGGGSGDSSGVKKLQAMSCLIRLGTVLPDLDHKGCLNSSQASPCLPELLPTARKHARDIYLCAFAADQWYPSYVRVEEVDEEKQFGEGWGREEPGDCAKLLSFKEQLEVLLMTPCVCHQQSAVQLHAGELAASTLVADMLPGWMVV